MSRRGSILWTDSEYAAVAARTVQLRDSNAYTNIMEACLAAQRELLPENRVRVPPNNGNLGQKFTDLVSDMRMKHNTQRELAITAYRAEQAAITQTELRLQEADAAPAPVAAPTTLVVPTGPGSPLGALLETVLRQAFDVTLEKMTAQIRAEIGPTLARLRPEFEKRVETTVTEALAESVAEALPNALPKLAQPEQTPRVQKIRVIVFGLLDAQIATVKESLRAHLEMHRVDVLCTKDKGELYKMHTETSHVIHVQKFSNHLPPDYFKRVKTLSVANGIGGVKDRILEVIKLERGTK